MYRFCKYVSYGFPLINFPNPGVHYETPCIFKYITLFVAAAVYCIELILLLLGLHYD